MLPSMLLNLRYRRLRIRGSRFSCGAGEVVGGWCFGRLGLCNGYGLHKWRPPLGDTIKLNDDACWSEDFAAVPILVWNCAGVMSGL